MGNICSDKPKIYDIAHIRNLSIESELKDHQLHEKINYKLLVLGIGESGKSTIIKQLMFIANKKLDKIDIDIYIQALRFNIIESMHLYLQRIVELNLVIPLELETDINVVQQKMKACDTKADTSFHTVIENLRASELIKTLEAQKNKFWNLELSDFYFDNTKRFFDPNFAPTNEDIILCRKKTLGVNITKIKSEPIHWSIVDVGGQKSEQRKWITQFDNVTVVIYVVNLTDYNWIAYDNEINKMKDALNVFEEVFKNPIFEKVEVYLIFNKKDLFDTLINTDQGNFKKCFPEYVGNIEYEACFEYILQQFTSKINKKIKYFIVTATIRQEIKETFSSIQRDIINSRRREINKSIATLKGRSTS